jgi:predicted PurR-regulated permease PerM
MPVGESHDVQRQDDQGGISKMKEKNAASIDITHMTLSVLFIGLLIASCFWILMPFLVSILWGGIIIVAMWPALMKLHELLGGKRGLAVAIMTVVILLIIFVPITFTIVTIVNNSEHITSQIKSLDATSLPAPPEWLGRIPVVGSRIADKWGELAALSPEERSALLTPYAQKALQWFAEQAGNIGMTLVHVLLTAIIAAILFAKGEVVRDGILRFARRLAGRQGGEVAVLAAKAVRGVVLGVVVTALIQAGIGGIGLFIAGVPAATLLTAVLVFFCLAQLGPLLVLVPAVIWLYWSGKPVGGTVLLFLTVVAGTIDNFVRPFLIKKGADLPLVMIFAGVIGGLIAFGMIGLFIGPVVLAVTYTLLKAWVSGDALKQETGAGSD